MYKWIYEELLAIEREKARLDIIFLLYDIWRGSNSGTGTIVGNIRTQSS